MIGVHKISFEVRTFYNKRETFYLAIFDGFNSTNNDPNLPFIRGYFSEWKIVDFRLHSVID